jgi:tripartite ATP-independent transporter DctP family solute receptor
MKLKKKLSLSLAVLLGSAMLLGACGKEDANGTANADGNQTVSFKLTHVTQPTHIWHRTAEKFNEELQARSDGRMKVDIFPAATLGPEKDMIQQIGAGTIDFGIITNAYMSSTAEPFNGWFMPFLFEDLEAATKARDTEPAKKMLQELDKQGIVGMDFILAGNRHILMKDKNIEKVEDLKGQKIRIIGSPAMQDFWHGVGAGPSPMPLPEVYTSLQTGVIDGIDIDLDALNTEKYYEIAKSLTLTNQMTFPGVVMMNKAKLESLSAEDQEIVNAAMKAAVDWGMEEAVAGEVKNLDELKGHGITITELNNPESFNAIRDEVYEKYSKDPIIKEFIEVNQK